MKLPKLEGVRVIEKPERGLYEDRDVHEKSSKIAVYNVFLQSWTDLQQEGLTHLFEDKAEFERKKEARFLDEAI